MRIAEGDSRHETVLSDLEHVMRLSALFAWSNREGPVLLTRDGRAVAVLLSAAEYGHLVNRPISFGQAYDEFL